MSPFPFNPGEHMYSDYNIFEDYDTAMLGEGPFYTDFLADVQKEYPTLGLASCDWNESVYTELAKHKERLITRFNREFAWRELGQESYTRWEHFLQCRLDEVADHFNHMYKVFNDNDVDQLGITTDVKENLDRKTTSDSDTKDVLARKMTSSMDTNSSRDADSKFKDTPGSSSSTLNNPTNQTVDSSKDTYHSDGGDTQDDDRHTIFDNDGTQVDVKTVNTVTQDETKIKELNYLADYYKSVDNEFIHSFDNMFMGIFAYQE